MVSAWKRRAVLALLACAAGAVAHAEEPLRVSAAASLTDAFRELAAAFERAHPERRVELNFAGSQVLRLQIQQGAPVDVFASADRLEPLFAANLVEEPQVFARSTLVAVRSRSTDRVKVLADLARPGVRVVVAGPAVPAGRYTADALDRLRALPGFGEAFVEGVQRNVASQETNVRAVLLKVALGEADAGFVYRTDVGAAAVVALEVPPPAQVAATYPIAVVAGSPRREAARAFVALVRSAEGQAVLRRHGFEAP